MKRISERLGHLTGKTWTRVAEAVDLKARHPLYSMYLKVHDLVQQVRSQSEAR